MISDGRWQGIMRYLYWMGIRKKMRRYRQRKSKEHRPVILYYLYWNVIREYIIYRKRIKEEHRHGLIDDNGDIGKRRENMKRYGKKT